MVRFVEMDHHVTLGEQLLNEVGPCVLVNVLSVDPSDVEDLLTAWAADSKFMKKQPGFISAQLHRGTSASSVFFNYAVWQSVEDFRIAFSNPDFQSHLGSYPKSTVVSPHLFQRIAVQGICVA